MASNIAVKSGCVGNDITCLNVLSRDDFPSPGFYDFELAKEIHNFSDFKDAKIEKKQVRFSPLICEKNNSCKDYEYAQQTGVIYPSHNQYALIYASVKGSGFVDSCELVSQEKVNGNAITIYVLTDPKKPQYVLGRDMFVLAIHGNFDVSPIVQTDFGKRCPLGKGSQSKNEKINEYCNPQSTKTGQSSSIACYARIVKDGWKINY